MSDSGSSFIKRNAPPRVQIQYEDPYDSERMVELPFVMGVLSDLSGNNPGVEQPIAEERTFSGVTKDTLDDYMESMQPGLSYLVDNKLEPKAGGKIGVDLRFSKMDDFDPAAIARQIPAMRELLEAREQIANLKRYIAAKPKAQDDVKKLLEDPKLLAVMAEQAERDLEKGQSEDNAEAE